MDLDLFGQPMAAAVGNPPFKPRTMPEKLNDYEGFVEKFKPKKTTDDCYTPPEVYECIRDWVHENILNLDGLNVRRPFYPGGDYQAEADGYGPEDVVVDNPPFSILSKIQDFYTSRGIRFFLFGPALTLFSAPRPGVTYIVADADIVYENGANVRTGFLTNMEGKHRIIVAGDLAEKVADIVYKLKAKPKLTKRWVYPDELVTSATLQRLAARGVTLKVPFDEAHFCRRLDNQEGSIFGGGYLISERAAAERAAAERAAGCVPLPVALSEREQAIVANPIRELRPHPPVSRAVRQRASYCVQPR